MGRRPGPPARFPARFTAGHGSSHSVKDLQQEHAIPEPVAFWQGRPAQNRAMPPTRADRSRVLLVDDDARLVHIVGLYLQVQQFDVVTAATGEEAMGLLTLDMPDLVILDVMMPGIDGISLCRRIRNMPGAQTLPIIVFTALSDAADLAAARDSGADRVITKPFNLTGLGAAVEALLPDAAAASA
jgi:CheY-like chemotaxis protein